MYLYVSSVGKLWRRGRVSAASGVLIVALITGVACTASGTGGEPEASSPYVLAEGEFDGGSWRLIARVDDGDLRLALRGSDGSERGVGDYTTPYTLREAEAWVVPSSPSGDGFVTLVAGPVPEGISPAVHAQEGGRRAHLEVVIVAGVPVFVATLEGAVRHLDVIARDSDGNEVGRETRQATYTRMGVRPPEGDTWVLDLLRERHWERAEIITRYPQADRGVRIVAWGDANNVVTGLADGVIENAFIDRMAVFRGGSSGRFRVTDGRFVPCAELWRPAGTSDSPTTSDFRAFPDLRLGIGAKWLAPWTELEFTGVGTVRVDGEEVIRGRRTYRVSLIAEHEEAAGRAPASRISRWLVDAETGIVIGASRGDAPAEPVVEIVAMNEEVEPPTFSEIRFPEGQVSYEVQQPPQDDGTTARDLVAVYDDSVTMSDGTLTLQDLIDEFAPAEVLIDCELRREPITP